MKLKKLTGLLLLVFSMTTVFAADDDGAAEQKLREILKERMPDLEVTSISESFLPGIYEMISESQVYYLSPDGRYMLDGSIIDLQERVNLSEQRRGVLQLSMIAKVPEEQMIVFNNEQGDADRWITVFTDSDCGYCQKLHREVDQLTAEGIRVRYLLFPRAGMESESFRELQSVWCADDQQSAMTVAKSGGQVDLATCENPIQEHVDLATSVGLRGTPLIYLDDGSKVAGYRPAPELVKMIKESEPLALK